MADAPHVEVLVERFSARIGRSGEPFEMPLERGKVREFARATLSNAPDYLDDPEPVTPPTFLMTCRYWMDRSNDALGPERINSHRGLHATQSFTFHGPPLQAGENLAGSERVEAVTRKHGRRGGELVFVTIATDYHDAAGILRATARRSLVQTSRAVQATS